MAVKWVAAVSVFAGISHVAVAAQPLELMVKATTAADPLTLRVRSIDAHGEPHPAPWPTTPEVRWLFVRVSGTQENRDATNLGEVDVDGARRVMPAAAGTALVGVDLQTTLEEWSPEDASEFGRLSGNSSFCQHDPISVRHSVSATAVVKIEPSAADARPISNHASMSKSGQSAEIRPLMDPTLIQGGDLAVRVYVGGEAVAKAQVRAVHATTKTVQTVQADSKGIAVVNVDLAGDWRIEFHTLVQLDEHWQATSSSLTFVARGAEPVAAAATILEVQP